MGGGHPARGKTQGIFTENTIKMRLNMFTNVDEISTCAGLHTVLTKSPLGDRLPFISTWGSIKALFGNKLG